MHHDYIKYTFQIISSNVLLIIQEYIVGERP